MVTTGPNPVVTISTRVGPGSRLLHCRHGCMPACAGSCRHLVTDDVIDASSLKRSTRGLWPRLHHASQVSFRAAALCIEICRFPGGLPMLVTELMNAAHAHTLVDRYLARPPLSLLQELRLLRDVSAAMSYLHSLDIIHRDLTTRNVLVSKEERAKVADVGLSRSLHWPPLRRTSSSSQ